MKTERKGRAIAFLTAAVAYHASLGTTVERVMTDNGSCYKAFASRRPAKRLGLRHIRARPCTLSTNRKAERFIQTALRDGLCQGL
jgi:transposase InsO family protein